MADPQPDESLTFTIERTDPALHEAPVIFVDGAGTFLANSQTVKFNFFQDRAVAKEDSTAIPIERVVCARLVMSPQVFQEFVAWINNTASRYFVAQEH